MKRLMVGAVFILGCVVARSVAEDPPKSGDAKLKIPDMVHVKMTTNFGDIYLELNQNKAPVTVENFLRYVDDGFYKGTIFHRVMPDFMIQGGGFDKDTKKEKKTRPPIKNEWKNGLSNARGTIAMARLPQPDSATAQFFINVVDNQRLDGRGDSAGYAVFGKVVEGLDVVDKIRFIPTTSEGPETPFTNIPSQPAIIERVTRMSESEVKEMEKKKSEGGKRAMEEGKNLVKSKGVDISKGKATPTGLWYADTTEGTGGNPSPSSTITAHYTGWLTNGTKFDSSLDRNAPLVMRLNGLIPGWIEGIGGMKKGGKRYLVVPPELGYGPQSKGIIPPNATLVFEVQLLDFNP